MKYIIKKIISYSLNIFFYFFKNTKVGLYFNNKLFNIAMNNQIKISYKNINFQLVNPTNLINYRIKTFHSKEPETLDWIDKFDDNSIFWDIGANIGLYSCYASLKKDCNVFSFEPSVFNLEILSRNIFINNLVKKITIIPLALSNKTMASNFSMTSTELGGAMSTFNEKYGHDGNKMLSIFSYNTLGITINDCIDYFNLKQPDYVKIDVDGIEHLILEGGKETLINTKSILIEVNDEFKSQFNKTKKILTKLGFKLIKKSHAEHFDFSKTSEKTTYNQIWVKE